MERVNIVWRRTGKEHGEGSGFRQNAQAVVDEHVSAKVVGQRTTPPEQWRWWQLNDDVLVEVPEPSEHYKPSTRILYLPKRHYVAIADLRFGGHAGQRRDWDPDLYWYVHIGDVRFREQLGAWVFTDLFADVTATRDGLVYRVKDLHDVAEVLRGGLLDAEKAAFILERTQALVEAMREGAFPFPEMQAALTELDHA